MAKMGSVNRKLNYIFYFFKIVTFKALKKNVLPFYFLFEYRKWKPGDRKLSDHWRAGLVLPDEM